MAGPRPRLAWARGRLPRWRDELAGMPLTLTHNDFWFTNLAVFWDGSSALLYDYNLTGMGLRASDLRNVTLGLTPPRAGPSWTGTGNWPRPAASR
ncbi:hypothetical protein G7085_06035 [Tessaracoccus sp. HDW20]|uniref:hypothetical protein n=1 Tax=Tessaracoccus coleopterorum TaxID=2714950 RepID=UPI0018D427D3|nr:hypothetical protein [Tessaracoccus coleopterorum]NHB84312.1 hypothetical protein [Tessaracoccus coleopterorum]